MLGGRTPGHAVGLPAIHLRVDIDGVIAAIAMVVTRNVADERDELT